MLVYPRVCIAIIIHVPPKKKLREWLGTAIAIMLPQCPRQSYGRSPRLLDTLLYCEPSIVLVVELQYPHPALATSPCCAFQYDKAWLSDSPKRLGNQDARVQTYNSIFHPDSRRQGHCSSLLQQIVRNWIYQCMHICHLYCEHQESGCLPNATPPCSGTTSSDFHQSFPLL